MFITVLRRSDKSVVVIRKDAIRFVEGMEDGVVLHVDGIGEIATTTYDVLGFATHVADLNIDDDLLSEVA